MRRTGGGKLPLAWRLALCPEIGAVRDDIRPGMRCLVSGSYVVLYKTSDADVEIVRAVHGQRDLIGLFHAHVPGTS